MRVSMSAIGSVIISSVPSEKIQEQSEENRGLPFFHFSLFPLFSFLRLLPTRLHHSRDLAAHHDFAQLAAPEPEPAVVAARASREAAAVALADRTRIARQLLERKHRLVPLLVGALHVLHGLAQLLAPGGILVGKLFSALVAFYHATLGHGIRSVTGN